MRPTKNRSIDFFGITLGPTSNTKRSSSSIRSLPTYLKLYWLSFEASSAKGFTPPRSSKSSGVTPVNDGMGKKFIFSYRLPWSSKVKSDTRWYSPITWPPIPSTWTRASRLKKYSLSARRNCVSFAVNLRMISSTWAWVRLAEPVVDGAATFVLAADCCARAIRLQIERASAPNSASRREVFMKGFIGCSSSIVLPGMRPGAAELCQWDRARLQLRQMREIGRLLPSGQNRLR